MTIQMQRRMLYIPVMHIDTNLINARQKLGPVNQLEKWSDDGVISINMSGTAHAEARAGGNADRRRKANMQIFTATAPASLSDPLYRRIERTLFPQGAQDDGQRNDVRIVFEAAKYSATLVTADGASRTQPGGILGNRDRLKELVNILSSEEAVDFVRAKIRDRDEFNRKVAKEFGGTLPPWTGLD